MIDMDETWDSEPGSWIARCGVSEAVMDRRVELAIASAVPPGFLGTPMMQLRIMAVAAADHPLHQLNRELSISDLRAHRIIIVRDSGEKRDQLTISLNVERCWTVANTGTAIEAVRRGDGYSWLPQDQISEELKNGSIKALPLREGGSFLVPLYLIKTSMDTAGPGVVRLAELISENVVEHCARETAAGMYFAGEAVTLPLDQASVP
jgi:DNA-binding transcriptional LysR family regulator